MFAVEYLLILERADKYLKEEIANGTVEANKKKQAKVILTIVASLVVHIKYADHQRFVNNIKVGVRRFRIFVD